MPPHLESDLLRTFVAIAETKNFTRASEIVSRTQSAVSIQMKKLEEIVNGKLFDRGPRGVTLTSSGEHLVKDAKRILSLLDQAAASLQTDPLKGTVRIGIPEEYGGTFLPSVLSRFAKTHPQAEVTVHCAQSEALNKGMEKGELDLIILHEEATKTSGEILLNNPIVWITSDTYCQHECTPMPVAVYDSECWWREWALACLDQQNKDYKITYVSSSTFGLQAAVSSGIAVGIVAEGQIPPDCRELTAEEGFPRLQSTNIVLRQNTQRECNTKAGMAQAIRDAFQASRA